MRLNKYLSVAGIASRRAADEMIKGGKVKVNGEVVTEFGVKIDPEKDTVEVNGQTIAAHTSTVVYLLNKPKGVITTASDPEGRKTVMDFVPKEPRVFPCGRLDENTQGLVILTNDGNLCYQLTHPKFEHKKKYVVEGVSKSPVGSRNILESGKITLSDGPAQIDELEFQKIAKDRMHFTITVHDGRNHLVRRICAKAGIEVLNLTRLELGQYQLGDIEPGKYEIVTE